MDVGPRSCCDPGDAVDLNRVGLDSLAEFGSFCVSSAKHILEFLLPTVGGASSQDARDCRDPSTSSDDAPTRRLSTNIMEEYVKSYVDHLRLPASTRVGVDLKDPHLWRTISLIILSPLIWNIFARIEFRTKILTKLCLGQSKVACFLLAVVILTLGLWRNHLFNLTCHTQPSWIFLRQNRVLILGYLSCIVGTTLVVTSFYQLGFFATFLGDYFGIFTHSGMVRSFPFSVVDDPMYFGSFLNFLGVAMVKSSPAGILLAFLVGLVYKVALLFETPFVTAVYEAKRAEINEALKDEDEEEEDKGKEDFETDAQRVRKKEK